MAGNIRERSSEVCVFVEEEEKRNSKRNVLELVGSKIPFAPITQPLLFSYVSPVIN